MNPRTRSPSISSRTTLAVGAGTVAPMTNPRSPDGHQDPESSDRTPYSEAELGRLLATRTGQSESRTAQLVRLRATTVQAHTALCQVYEELRQGGDAFAWSAAYEASGATAMLLLDLSELLGERTPTPAPDIAHPAAPCRSTQHCLTWDWCHRCDPNAAQAVPHIIKAVQAMGIAPGSAGSAYATTMAILRDPTEPASGDSERLVTAIKVMDEGTCTSQQALADVDGDGAEDGG